MRKCCRFTKGGECPRHRRSRKRRATRDRIERETRGAQPRYKRLKLDKLAKIKVDRGCADCGFSAHPEALDFDHLPGYTKVANVSQMAGGYSWDRILAEVAKCEVVCANCHRIRTSQRRAGDERGIPS